MAAAYRYADEEDAKPPDEIELINYANKFGWQAVLGSSPGAGVLRRIVMVENIMNWHKEREKAENWVKWENDNPEQARVLKTAMRLAHDGE